MPYRSVLTCWFNPIPRYLGTGPQGLSPWLFAIKAHNHSLWSFWSKNRYTRKPCRAQSWYESQDLWVYHFNPPWTNYYLSHGPSAISYATCHPLTLPCVTCQILVVWPKTSFLPATCHSLLHPHH